MAAQWTFTDDPSDPCSLCVQWRRLKHDKYDYEPYMPDGSVPPRIWRGIHDDHETTKGE